MNISQHKKGSERLKLTLVSLILVLVCAYFLISLAVDSRSESRYLLDYYSSDLKMTLESIQALPGDMEIFYELEENYKATIEEGKIILFYEPSERTKIQTFHLLPGIIVQQNTVTNTIGIIKKGNILTFATTTVQENICHKPTTFMSKDFTVAVQKGTANEENTFTPHLDPLIASIEYNLEQAKLLGKNPTITLLLSSAQVKDSFNHIRIISPKGTPETEAEYNYFYCTLQQINLPIAFIKETTDIEKNTIELVFALNETIAVDFIKGTFTQTFPQKIVNMFSPLQKEAAS